MMHTIRVHAEHEYEVVIGCQWQSTLTQALDSYTRVALVYSSAMRDQIQQFKPLNTEIHYFEVSDGEGAKTSQTLQSLWNWLGAAGFTRSDAVVGIGGGTITDLAGFAAASWLRGVDWIAVPTTVAGMVDAAIGGKTGINSDYGKNLIGAFHSPKRVLIDTSWLLTLSDRDFAAGLAETIKCGFIVDAQILNLVKGKSLANIRSDAALVQDLITRSVAVKAHVVGIDFKESFGREVLNYGHTLGHAIEIHSKYSLRHGEAVAIGLVFAAELAGVKGILDSASIDLHKQTLASLGLPTTYPADAWQHLYPLLALDKKSRGHQLRFVGLRAIGETLRIEDANESELAAAYERISS
jgi:3-dehydroquinate synthase